MSVDPPYKVLLVGHSYVYWLRCFAETTLPGSGFGDFVVDGTCQTRPATGSFGLTDDSFTCYERPDHANFKQYCRI